MNDEPKTYVVNMVVGEYAARSFRSVRAFKDQAKAKAYATRKNRRWDKLYSQYHQARETARERDPNFGKVYKDLDSRAGKTFDALLERSFPGMGLTRLDNLVELDVEEVPYYG